MPTVIKNIGLLYTGRRKLKDVDLLIDGGRVKDIGRFTGGGYDCEGQTVIPGFVDAHTHLIFAGDRADELEERLQGKSYLDIARRGGGIMATVRMTRAASEEELFELAQQRIKRMIRYGTTTVEIKSGYGLSTEEEIKILKVIKNLRTESPIDIIPTFLGAHVIPTDIDRASYVAMIVDEMLPRIAEEKLAEFCDVFCDEGAFTLKETETILSRAKELGFKLKVHAEELTHTGVASLAAEMGAVSCDHLNRVSLEDLKKMKENGTIAVLLPGTSFYLGTKPPPIAEIKRAGVDIAIATDYNPGTCPILVMPIIVAIGALYYRIPIRDTIRGATYGGALALGRKDIGMLEKGFLADLLVLRTSDLSHLIYHFADDNLVAIFKRGDIIYHR
ncbi:imidazolonepropionase [candidate division WOR-3 bacterium]|uniref:Imidazolonepropionase n=1 Tax=candidate division WOR-3 bacterium TaxID=2052148 RepID=A0A660SI41_UNCW3|nr:MAG: imidazolonepropionase [candidate division WOR-3 bacterium]